MKFEDKVVIVTGGDKGIGRATAVAYAKEGAAVAIASIDQANGELAEKELRQFNPPGVFVLTDVSREEEVRSMVEKVVADWGRVDILVNNAGIYRQANALETSLELWDKILTVNLTGAFLCTKYAVPEMIKNGSGVIINVSSEAGLVGIKGQVAYNVSKAGMIALTRSCAVDLAPMGIRVNCVCPGTTDTPLVQEAIHRTPDPVKARRDLEQVRPLNRLGIPEEIASAILYLSSDEAGYATGAILSVDGGYTAQ